MKFDDNALVITLIPPFKMPSFARFVKSVLDKSTASFFVIFVLYIFAISSMIWTFKDVVVIKSITGRGLTNITPPVIQVYLFINFLM